MAPSWKGGSRHPPARRFKSCSLRGDEAGVAELEDAPGSNPGGPPGPWEFDSPRPHLSGLAPATFTRTLVRMTRAWRTAALVLALAVLAVASCGSGAAPSTTAEAPPDTEPPATSTTETTSPPSTTEPDEVPDPPAAELAPASDERAAAESSVTAWLSLTAPPGVSGDEIVCVAAGIVSSFDDVRLELVTPLADAAARTLPVAEMTESEQDLVLDGVVSCLPWTPLMRSMLAAEPGFPPAARDCLLGYAATDETDRLAASAALFGRDLMDVYNDLVPSECLLGVEEIQAETPAGSLTAAQLVLAGVSAESAECVAAAVDAISQDPDTASGELSEQQAEQAFAAIFGCLTPEELDLLDDPDGGLG